MTHEANILSFNEVKAHGASAPRTVSSRRTPSASSDFRRSGNRSSSARHASRSGQSARTSRFAADDYLSGGVIGGVSSKSGSMSSGQAMNARRSGISSRFVTEERIGQGLRHADIADHANSAERFSHASSTRLDRGSEGNVGSGFPRRSARTVSRRSGTLVKDRSRGSMSMRSDDRTADARVSDRRRAAHSSQEKQGLFRTLQKRFRTAKADREFDRTEGARERRAAAEAAKENSSRAALYEMRMGSTQRRSARMQDEDRSGKFPFGFSLPFSLPVGSLSAAATRGIVALAVVGLTVFMLYPTCQNYYNETRSLQQLQAEYEVITDYNDQLQSQVNYLSTQEGLEEYARTELGLIRQDENMVTVEGVEPSSESTSDSSATHSPLNEKISAPDTWYSGVLDVLFGYRS